jgi:lipoprotein-anchoring transpeptidase ErfK/SrfK
LTLACDESAWRAVDRFSTIRSAARRAVSRRRDPGRRCVAAAVLALAALAAAPGAAQQGGGAPGANAGTKPAEAPSGPVLAVVSVSRQHVSIYGESHGQTRLIAQSPVSTGMPGYRTPTGVFSVLQKQRYHESNIYSGAPMPFMQRLTWSGIALHAGVLPGYPASHGCIRLPHRFAVDLYGMTRLGTRVVVTPDDAPVLPIEHPRLPAARLAPGPADADRQPQAANPGARGPELTSAVALRVTDAADELAARGVRLLNPLQRVMAAKVAATHDAVVKGKAARVAAEIAAAKAAEARQGKAALDNAETSLAAAQSRLEMAARAAAAAAETPAAERLNDVLAAAQESLAEAERAADAAWLISAALAQEAAEAATATAEADGERRAAEGAVKAAERTTDPISILVSRKAGRVLVRQGWAPVHEASVRFLDDGPALGTHVYLATGVAEDGETMRWLSVSLPSSASGSPRPRERRGDLAPGASATGRGHETAAGALGRFELPEETRRFIADRLWAGATLIVSDNGPSGETGLSTDFIVLTR